MRRSPPPGYKVRIIADSRAPNGKRLTTWELTYPRFVHAELLTHRLFSRNSASSRAIPNKTLRGRISKNPVIPIYWGRNQKGMQAGAELTGWRLWAAIKVWLLARWTELFFSWVLGSCLDLHKQIANRLVEPHMFITVLVTATEFDNWFRLRANPAAQPEIKWVAEEMQELYATSEPLQVSTGDWHLPFITNEDFADACNSFGCGDGLTKYDEKFDKVIEFLKKISVARCARVSYLTHNGRKDFKEDIRLHNDLSKKGHWSPFEHVAQACPEGVLDWSGNIQGWYQYREEIDPHFTKVGR